MRNGLLAFVLVVATILVTGTASAALTDVRSTPRQAQLTAGGDNVVAVTWRVSATADHTFGVSSRAADIVDPSAGTNLMLVNTTFDAAGAGPFSFREVIRIDAATVRTWIDRGVSRVVLTRSFGDATGNSVDGAVVLRLNRSHLQATRDAAVSLLDVQSLRIEFGAGNNTAVVAAAESLRALLTVQYTGAGVLRGRWQIAEPESPDAAPLFRTLALVNTNLATNQRSALRSPALPTSRAGRYLLRFCVSSSDVREPGSDAQCPNADLVAVASYHVQGREQQSVTPITGLAPNRQVVSPATRFSWRSLSGAHIYQLQVFAMAPADAGMQSAREDVGSIEPVFVTGMLLDSSTSDTALSKLVQSKLEKGHRYLWRVTAHDESGRMIGKSAEASFVFSAAE